MNSACKRLLTAGMSLALSACISYPPAQTEVQFILERKTYARQLEQKKDFYGALNQWQIASLLRPSDPEINPEIDRLEKLIHTTAESYFSRGRTAYNGGNIRLAEIYFLKTLAADPHHQAFNYLKKINTLYMRAAQDNKNQTARNSDNYQSPLKKVPTFVQLEELFKQKKYLALSKLVRQTSLPKTDRRVFSLLYESDYQLTQYYIQKKEITRATFHFEQMQARAPKTTEHKSRVSALKKKLADGHYTEAKTFLNSDLSRTISGLRKALSYEPKHPGAQVLLNQAERMQKNLLKIKQLK